MGRRPSAWGLIALACMSSACLDYVTIDEGMSVPVVLSVLVAGGDSVFLGLGTSGPGTETGPAPGAELALLTQHGAVFLTESGDDPGPCGAPPGFSCYAARIPVPLAPGDSVRLVGHLSSGKEIRGEVVLPAVPNVSLSGRAPGDTVRFQDRSLDPLSVVVGKGEGRVALSDSTVRVTVWADGQTRDCHVPVTYPPKDLDLRVWYFSGGPGLAVGGPACDGQRLAVWDSLIGSVAFLGYDDHATRWYESHGRIWPDEGGAQGVEGALGVFGAATPAVFVIRITARASVPLRHLEVGP